MLQPRVRGAGGSPARGLMEQVPDVEDDRPPLYTARAVPSSPAWHLRSQPWPVATMVRALKLFRTTVPVYRPPSPG